MDEKIFSQEYVHETVSEVIFENKRLITRQEREESSKLNRRNFPFIFWSSIIISLACTSILISEILVKLIYNVRIDYFYMLCSGGLLALTIYLNIRSRIALKKSDQDLVNIFGKEEWELIVQFKENSIDITSDSSSSVMPYTAVKEITEEKDCFHVIFTKNYFLDKSRFTIGEADYFREFIEGKTRKKCVYLTNKRKRLRTFKQCAFITLLMVFLCAIWLPDIWQPAYQENQTLIEQVSWYLDEDKQGQIVTIIELDGGAVGFWTEDDDIGAVLFRKSHNGYDYVHALSYSIRMMDNWSKQYYQLFEGGQDFLQLDNWRVVYGVVSADFWENYPESVKNKYPSYRFEQGEEDFIFYYRVITEENIVYE